MHGLNNQKFVYMGILLEEIFFSHQVSPEVFTILE